MSEQTYARVHARMCAHTHTHSHRVCGHLIYFRCFAQMSYKVLSVSVYLRALSVFVCLCVFLQGFNHEAQFQQLQPKCDETRDKFPS